MRVGDRIAHARLRPEVDNAVDAEPSERRVERREVGEVGVDEAEGVVVALELCDAVALQLDAVIVIEAVEADDLFAAIEQPARYMVSDEACCASHQYRHMILLHPNLSSGIAEAMGAVSQTRRRRQST